MLRTYRPYNCHDSPRSSYVVACCALKGKTKALARAVWLVKFENDRFSPDEPKCNGRARSCRQACGPARARGDGHVLSCRSVCSLACWLVLCRADRCAVRHWRAQTALSCQPVCGLARACADWCSLSCRPVCGLACTCANGGAVVPIGVRELACMCADGTAMSGRLVCAMARPCLNRRVPSCRPVCGLACACEDGRARAVMSTGVRVAALSCRPVCGRAHAVVTTGVRCCSAIVPIGVRTGARWCAMLQHYRADRCADGRTLL